MGKNQAHNLTVVMAVGPQPLEYSKKIDIGALFFFYPLTAKPVFSLYTVVVNFFAPDRKTIFFNSHQVSKPESSSDLTAVSSIRVQIV